MSNARDKFMNLVDSSLKESTFIRLTMGKYRGNEELEKVYVRPVVIKGRIKYQFNYRYKNRDLQKNFEREDCLQLIRDELGKRFLNATLFTTSSDVIIEYNKRRIPRIIERKPTFTETRLTLHNKPRVRFIDQESLYLKLLGITSNDGEIKSDKYAKFRQIDKFIEIFDSLYRASDLVSRKKIKAVDFGSGKSYLSFALYDWLRNHVGINICIAGVEQRKELVEFSNQTARELNFENLRFIYSKISEYEAQSVDIITALHACDTATDDAIFKALRMQSSVIVLAPCCHKYVRNKLKIPYELRSILKHGIIEEHFASFLTDSLRALVLEYYGYKTKVFEFISYEHTSKNIMINAVKLNKSQDKNKIEEIIRLKSMFGLQDFYLDKILKL